ncbi:Wzy polymerase domain-containing protein [Variovorax sp. M-6]|uniref:PglL family O-oligosaccharyltransferase n=1 Tax=Variovorax sp. M-6 TaxID=3233041 RepID=UPI003F9487EE
MDIFLVNRSDRPAGAAMQVDRTWGAWARAFMRPIELPFNPWWLLWTLTIAGAWLLPTHFIPWAAFHADLAMVLALLPGAFWIVSRSPKPLSLNVSVIVALLSACVPLLQFASGLIYFAGDAWIVSAYLFGFALALLVGARFQQLAPGQLADSLLFSIGVAALLSTALILYQLLSLSGLGLLALNLPTGYRPFANLGQPNHVATLLVWGLVAIWWAYLSRRMRGWIAVLAAAFLMVGIVATQSRTAWLEITLLGIGAVLYRRPLGTRRYAPTLVALAAFFALMVVTWQSINHALHFDAARTVSDEMSPGLRPAAWELFLNALTLRPWTGWGWNQLSVAQSAVALEHPSLRYTFQSAHNLVLDLLVQNGVLLGGLMTAALALWLTVKALRVNTAEGCLLLFAIGVLLTHSLLEFPQTYAYFLLPAGLMMGALDEECTKRRALALGRWPAVAMLSVGAALTSWIAIEYNLAERSLERVRFERNRVGPSRNSKPPELVMLTQLREFLWFLRLKAGEKVSPSQLEAMRAIVERYPSDGNQLVYAMSAAQNGHADTARDALTRMCLMVPRARCEAALNTWREIAVSSPVLSAIEMPKVSRPRYIAIPTAIAAPEKQR